jgi:ribosome maturation factor RimP
MSQEPNKEIIEQLLQPILAELPDVFLVQVKVKPADNIKVFVDTDAGISIDRCIKINRGLYAMITERGLFEDGAFSLEVSSPGVGEPIILNRQYLKNVGRWFVVHLKDEKQLEGMLTDCTEDGIVLEEVKGKGKKLEKITHTVLFDDIKKAIVEVKI